MKSCAELSSLRYHTWRLYPTSRGDRCDARLIAPPTKRTLLHFVHPCSIPFHSKDTCHLLSLHTCDVLALVNHTTCRPSVSTWLNSLRCWLVSPSAGFCIPYPCYVPLLLTQASFIPPFHFIIPFHHSIASFLLCDGVPLETMSPSTGSSSLVSIHGTLGIPIRPSTH